MLRIIAIGLLASAALLAAQERTKFKLAAPPRWAGETIPLPPGFAPDMKVKGVEHIRFAPGMMDPKSDTFFSYAFAFELEPKPALTEATLKEEFLKYYRGLCKAVLRGERPVIDPSEFTLALKQKKSQTSAKGVTRYEAQLKWVEPFATKKEQTLNLEIQTWSRDKRNYVFACVSPQKRNAAIWKQLHKIRDDYASSVIKTTATADWPRWRGPADHGSIEAGEYPSSFADKNVVWRAALPGRGCSTPIVWRKSIYVTAPIDGNDGLLCFDWSGKEVWRAKFSEEDPGKHRNGSGCNASPATDGDAVFAYFKSGTLAAVELDGSVRWQTNLVEKFGKAVLFWDHGTSPVLTDKHVIMARMHHGDSWVAAFDKQTGKIAWKVARNYTTPLEGDHGYATPLVIQHNGKEAILVWGAEHMTIHDALDGRVVWSCGEFNPDSAKLWPSISTPVIVGDMAVVAFGRNDRGKPKLHGIRLSGSGDATKSSHAWARDDIGTFVPSLTAYKGRVYLVGDRGRVVCIDPANGKTVWSGRFPKNRKAFYASPLIAGDKLYAAREDGIVFVASIANDKFELLAENDMEESVIGSPIPVMNRIFLRGDKHLFCFSTQ